jgi:leucine dehydrogenase
MEIFKEIVVDKHEQVVFCSDKVSNLRSIIAIHDTTLGPAIGGVRMYPYKSEDDALKDVLLLSKAMTYKAAAVGVNLGGGQGVIIGDPEKEKAEILLRAFGKFVDGLNGRYITAEDLGTTVEDMEIVRYETKYVAGLSRAVGGGGDPGPVSAIGVYYGILACVEKVFKERELSKRSVLIQGLGNVGYSLAQQLADVGAKLFVADVVESKVERAREEFNAQKVDIDKVFEIEVDIFSPCALGGVINKNNIDKIKAKIIAGAANNQLEDDQLGNVLQKRNILYAPDFVIGAGGLINVANELEGYVQERARKQASGIYDILVRVFQKAEKEGVSTSEAANRLALERLSQVKNLRQRHI